MRAAQAVMADLAASGLTPEQLALVMELSATVAAEARPAIDQAAENKRAYDREYHRNHRKNRTTSYETHDNNDQKGSVEVSPAPLPNHSKNSLPPAPKGASPQKNDPDKLTATEVIEAWQERMVPRGFPAIAKMTGERERKLRARLKDSTLEEWQRAMDALERSAFCRGENDRGWRADFDFLLQPKSFTKLLEGAYDH
jgi:hypothetical protein